MFGPRDLYRPGETVILNALLRDSDGKPLAEQPVKLEVVQPDGQGDVVVDDEDARTHVTIVSRNRHERRRLAHQ